VSKTRRLRELTQAASFALFFSDDAVGVEATLHREFAVARPGPQAGDEGQCLPGPPLGVRADLTDMPRRHPWRGSAGTWDPQASRDPAGVSGRQRA
jgi:hypothetical protein